jgi:hypothetical protein
MSNSLNPAEKASLAARCPANHQPPAKRHSFLIDAGAEYLGYAADLTRSYAAQRHQLELQQQSGDTLMHLQMIIGVTHAWLQGRDQRN